MPCRNFLQHDQRDKLGGVRLLPGWFVRARRRLKCLSIMPRGQLQPVDRRVLPLRVPLLSVWFVLERCRLGGVHQLLTGHRQCKRGCLLSLILRLLPGWSVRKRHRLGRMLLLPARNFLRLSWWYVTVKLCSLSRRDLVTSGCCQQLEYMRWVSCWLLRPRIIRCVRVMPRWQLQLCCQRDFKCKLHTLPVWFGLECDGEQLQCSVCCLSCRLLRPVRVSVLRAVPRRQLQ